MRKKRECYNNPPQSSKQACEIRTVIPLFSYPFLLCISIIESDTTFLNFFIVFTFMYLQQYGLNGHTPMDPDLIFHEVQTCSLEEIFGIKEGKSGV